MKQLAQTRRPVLLQPHFAEESDGSLGSQFAKTESTKNSHVGDRTRVNIITRGYVYYIAFFVRIWSRDGYVKTVQFYGSIL